MVFMTKEDKNEAPEKPGEKTDAEDRAEMKGGASTQSKKMAFMARLKKNKKSS